MKLLSKSELVDSKGKDRKMEIDEAVKLARKIDILRETAAKEETSLAKFRDESLAQVKKEIDALIARKSFLENEITTAISERNALQVPLDREWERVKRFEDGLTQFGLDLNQKHTDLQEKEMAFDNKDKELKVEKARIDDIKTRIEQDWLESEAGKAKAKQILAKAEKKMEKVIAEAAILEKELLEREANVAVKERENKLKEKELKHIISEISNRERAVNDKYQTLLRSQKRLNK